MKSRAAAWACLLTALSACASEDDAPIAAAELAILGGAADTDPSNDAVLAVVDPTAGRACTGTLIAPRWVALQAFCAPTDGPEGLTALFGADMMSPDATLGIADVIVHPDHDPLDMNSPQIALMRLDGDAPPGVMPIPALPAASGLTDADEGTALTWLGFGPTTRDGTDVGTRRTVSAPIATVCDDGTECSGATDIFLVDLSSGGPCTADGPGFIDRAGTRYLAGISYAGDMDCAVEGMATSLSAQEDFLDSVFGACAGPSDCLSGFCVDGRCCTSTCDGECERCDAPEAPGICVADEDGTACTGGVCTAGVCGAADADADADGDAETDSASDVPADAPEDALDAAEGGDGAPPDVDTSGGGCACRAAPGAGESAWSLLGLALVAACRARRRRP